LPLEKWAHDKFFAAGGTLVFGRDGRCGLLLLNVVWLAAGRSIYLINTPLQRGGGPTDDQANRFNGLPCADGRF
jgi:hypothetical protein